MALRRGDQWAAVELYERLHPVVERALRRVLRHRVNDYEDLVQSSFERIVRTLAERRFAGACSLATWASAIAAHVAMDWLRARVRERRVFGEQPARDERESAPPEPADPAVLERRLEARADVEKLQGMLSRMGDEQAAALVLHDVLGHELSEIAVLTGVSVAAAQSRLVRGRKELLRRAGGGV